MGFRDDWSISILLNLIAAVLYRLFVHPWLEPLVRATGPVSIALYRRLIASCGRFAAQFGRRSGDLTPGRLHDLNLSISVPSTATLHAKVIRAEPLPPGTASAIAMAMQPAPQRSPLSQFVNNSHLMQWEAFQRQHDIAARVAMDSQMNGTPAVLLR